MLCNAPCTPTAASPTSLTCTTGPLTTAAAVSALDLWNPSSALMGTVSPASAAGALDLDVTLSFTACTVTIDLGAATRGIVAAVAFFPGFQQAGLLAGATFQGSVNGSAGSYDTLYTIPAWAQQGWTTVPLYNGPGTDVPVTDLGSLPAYRFLRFAFAPGTPSAQCTAREVAFQGIPVAASASGACRPVVTVSPIAASDEAALFAAPVAPVSTTAAASVAYSLAATPVVTDISPANGSSLGGDVITLTGTGFPAASTAAVTVVLNGIPCAVLSTTATAVTCVTGPRPYGQIAPASVAVSVAGAGLALYDARDTAFRYLDRWSALTTWQYQEPPVEGDTVVIPPGQVRRGAGVALPDIMELIFEGGAIPHPSPSSDAPRRHVAARALPRPRPGRARLRQPRPRIRRDLYLRLRRHAAGGHGGPAVHEQAHHHAVRGKEGREGAQQRAL